MDFDDDDDLMFESLDLESEQQAPAGPSDSPKPGPSSKPAVEMSSTSNSNEPKKPSTTFKDKTIENLLKKSSGGRLTKISEPAVKCTGELLRIYTLEALTRSAEQAMKEGATTVTTDHLEKVLAQFLLDLN